MFYGLTRYPGSQHLCCEGERKALCGKNLIITWEGQRDVLYPVCERCRKIMVKKLYEALEESFTSG